MPSAQHQHTNTGWHFDNSYTLLPEAFFARQQPAAVRLPKLVVFNETLARQLGLNPDALKNNGVAAVFSGQQLPGGADPIAQAYAGHQFGYPTMLGDGRALVLGEQVTPGGERFDIQFKGSGRTPFSRRGDGLAALGPMLREHILSEAMHALGIPTTRSLAVVTTGEAVYRESVLHGAILTRVAASHIRVGTFEYAASRRAVEDLRALADYTLRRHFPERLEADQPYLALLQEAMERQAALVAHWQRVGFIHGVMNTDNMALCGETIDYGPCAFMDAYDPATVFSSIDQQGRYAYGNQPTIARWNLARFAETLLPLLSKNLEDAVDMATDAINTFPDSFRSHWIANMRAKLGLFNQEGADGRLMDDLLELMHRHEADFTNTFRDLAAVLLPDTPLYSSSEFKAWRKGWLARRERQPEPLDASTELMRAHNPTIIPRNHQVEAALSAAEEQNNYSVMEDLLELLKEPYLDPPLDTDYHRPAPPSDKPYQTFCGT